MLGRKVNKNKDKVNKPTAEYDKIAIYVVTEKKISSIYGYFKSKGLPLQKSFTDVEEAKIAMLTESRPTRLIVVESGLGKFMGTSVRKDIIDLVGICDGVNKKVSVFFTNSLLKGDILKYSDKRNKDIIWKRYDNTIDVIKSTLELGEEYIDSNEVDTEDNVENILKFKGINVEIESDIRSYTITGNVDNILEDIVEHRDSESLKKFNVSIY